MYSTKDKKIWSGGHIYLHFSDKRSLPTCPSNLPADRALKAPCGLFVVDFRVHFKASSNTSIFCIIYFILQCAVASVHASVVGAFSTEAYLGMFTFTSSHHAHQIPPACDLIARSPYFVVPHVFLLFFPPQQ